MAKDQFNKSWIIENSIDIISGYRPGELTIRALHYRLVARGMTNTQKHYKRVVHAMIHARWEGIVSFDTFSDHDRAMIGETDYEKTSVESSLEDAKESIEFWLNYYRKNRWENQPNYVEVFIEKKALQGVFEPICKRMDVALGACKGYPSLTFLKDTANRFNSAIQKGKEPIILYFGDYDPSGEDIPRSIVHNLSRLGVEVNLVRRALMEDQVIEMNLPPAPAKTTDTRTKNWDGLGQVELDAVEPRTLKQMCSDAINEYLDQDLYDKLNEQEKEEKEEYIDEIKKWVKEK